MLQPRSVQLCDPQRDFIIETDGSLTALGDLLKQKLKDTGLEHHVGVLSRALTGSEINYPAYKLEFYAVVRALKNFRMFLLGR